MVGGMAALAALWVVLASDRWDFEPSSVRPAPRPTWRAVRSPEVANSADWVETTTARRRGRDDGDGVRVSFEETDEQAISTKVWPREIAEAFGRLETAQKAAITGQPVEAWRFEPVRAGYEGLLKAHAEDAALQAEIGRRLARLSRLERASEAARKVEAILGKSHRRDQNLSLLKQSLVDEEKGKAHAFKAIGMIQPSSKRIEGRKLYVLIANNGSRRAYLDIPPGIDADRLIAHRVGIRGDVNYDDDLGSRVISVRDVEELRGRE